MSQLPSAAGSRLKETALVNGSSGVWDREVDLLVIGSGAGGMTAALVAAQEGLKVLLCEKTSLVGGTTATSGGTIWVPGSNQSKLTARPDKIEDARTYLDGEVGKYGSPSCAKPSSRRARKRSTIWKRIPR